LPNDERERDRERDGDIVEREREEMAISPVELFAWKDLLVPGI
jgi:hypothetical protein